MRQELGILSAAIRGVPSAKIGSVHRRGTTSESAADLFAHYLAVELLDDEGRGVVVPRLAAVGLGE